MLEVERYADFDDFLRRNPDAVLYPVETEGRTCYTQMHYEKDAFLLFGKESTGLPPSILERYPETSVRIPMKEGVISMNLSDCVSIVLFEALRQHAFAGLT